MSFFFNVKIRQIVIFFHQQYIVLRVAMIHFGLSRVKEIIPDKIHLYLLIFSILLPAFAAICHNPQQKLLLSTTFFGVNTILSIYLIILGGMGLPVIFWQQSRKYYLLSFAYPFRSSEFYCITFSLSPLRRVDKLLILLVLR